MNRLLIGLLLLSVVGCSRPRAPRETATQGTLLVAVSESHAGLIQAVADEFNATYTTAHVSVQAMSTREAIVSLLTDSVRCVVIDRGLNAEERSAAAAAETRFDEMRIAEDALAVVVHPLTGVDTVSVAGVESILTRRTTDWSEVPGSDVTGPITLVMTDRNSGVYELLQTKFLTTREAFAPTVIGRTQDEVLRYVSGNPGAVGVVSLACFKGGAIVPKRTEVMPSKPVRALSFVGPDSTGQRTTLALHQANVHLGKYPWHYPVYFCFSRERSELAAGFVSFIMAARGQQIILNWGLVPVTMPVRLVQLT
jgi:phosphate transport system substrate-binding protein